MAGCAIAESAIGLAETAIRAREEKRGLNIFCYQLFVLVRDLFSKPGFELHFTPVAASVNLM